MDALIPFLLEHWVLSSAFFIIVLLLLLNELRHRRFGLKSLEPQAVVDLINHHQGMVLDVRPSEQFKAGHIIGAENVTASELNKKLKKLQRFKSKPLVLVCDKGLDAPNVGGLLRAEGFEQIYLLNGGLVAWKGQGLPLVKD